MAKPRYDDEFRASAILMAEAAGWPNSPGALDRTAAHLGIPRETLRRWCIGTSNPPPHKVVHRKRVDLVAAIKDELAAIFPAMETARDGASYKDLATAAAIFTDKLQLLEGKPTAINEERNGDARDRLARGLDSRAAALGTDSPTQRPN